VVGVAGKPLKGARALVAMVCCHVHSKCMCSTVLGRARQATHANVVVLDHAMSFGTPCPGRVWELMFDVAFWQVCWMSWWLCARFAALLCTNLPGAQTLLNVQTRGLSCVLMAQLSSCKRL